MGAGLKYLDVGGGLGVDYDGSQTNFESSVNYTLEEYAQRRRLSHPDRLRRRGREAPDRSCPRAAGRSSPYHSVLIFNVLGVSAFGEEKIPESIAPDEAEQPLIDLLETYQQPDVCETRSRAITTRSRRWIWR